MTRRSDKTVVRFTGATTVSYPPDQFLRHLADVAEEENDFDCVLVIALRKHTAPTVHASSMDAERNMCMANMAASFLTTRFAARLSSGTEPGTKSSPPDAPEAA